MHLPSFSYPVTRTYPYNWFPWVVIIGGIIATVFFSALNVAANGYNLVVQYTTNPNATLAQERWTQRFPFSMVQKMSSSCQSQNIPINSQFFTDKLSLEYTLTGVWQEQDGDVVTLPSLRYTNNTLENCYVNIIQVDLRSTQRTSEQQAWKQWGPEATALVSCSINNGDSIPTWFNMTVGYDFVTPTSAGLNNGTAAFSFLNLNRQTKASLWWAQSLLSWYWLDLSGAIAASSYGSYGDNEGNFSIVQGNVGFSPSESSDIKSLEFFQPEYDFVSQEVFNDGTLGQPNCCFNPGSANLGSTLSEYITNGAFPYIWTEADTFAKAFYSAVLADLGQNSTVNIVADAALLQKFTSDFETMTGVETQWLKAGPARKSYDELRDTVGPLIITPSTIYAQYFCQVPELKSGGSLFVAVLVADLVFLQALWKILTWSTFMWLDHRDKTAKHCEGCLGMQDQALALDQELPDGRTATSQYELFPTKRPGVIHRKAVSASSESQEPLVWSDQIK